MKYSIAVTHRDGHIETIRGRCKSFLLLAGNESSLAVRTEGGTAAAILWLLLEAFRAIVADVARVLDDAAVADFDFGMPGTDSHRSVSEVENFVFASESHDGGFSCLVSPDPKMTAFLLEIGRANILRRLLEEDAETAPLPHDPLPPSGWQ